MLSDTTVPFVPQLKKAFGRYIAAAVNSSVAGLQDTHLIMMGSVLCGALDTEIAQMSKEAIW